MSNTILHDQVSAFARAWTSACALGIHRPKVVMTPLVWNTDGFAFVQPSTVQAVMAAAPLTTLGNYQDKKTRISAAGGGVSGSPPTWDPV